MSGPTPSQTIGPYFAIGLPYPYGHLVVPEGTPAGIWIRGSILDGEGAGVPDAMVETWQADPRGRFAPHAEGFRGFARAAADPQGGYAIHTLKPGRVPASDGILQAPHADVFVFARGLLKPVVTRIYFSDEAEANASDPVLASLTGPAARATLVAQATEGGYRFDIRLQGEGETVFFHV
jgi:protocatechuate 3,4-dioxygenase alpha subunit